MPLILNVHEVSQPARAVTWFAAYADVSAEQKMIDLFGAKEQKEASYLAKFPAGKVPTLEHDGFYLEEGAAMLQYLAELQGVLQPETAKARAELAKWLARHHTAARRVTLDVIGPMFFAPEDKKAELVKKGIEAVQPHLKAYEAHLAGKTYLTGDELSVADFLLVTEIDQLVIMKDAIGADLLADYPALRKYLERMAEVKGYKENVEGAKAYLAKMAAAKAAAAQK